MPAATARYFRFVSVLFLFLSFLLAGHNLQGQITIWGSVVDEVTREPLVYANIGLKSKTYGTISNTDGSFSLTLSLECLPDTLLFSMLGYHDKWVPVASLADTNFHQILLLQKVTLLEEVTIQAARKVKTKKLTYGNEVGLTGFIYSDSIHAGAAMALLIKPPLYPFTLKEASLQIQNNAFDTLKVRLRLFKQDSLGLGPGEDILQQSIIIRSTKKKGWVHVDVSKYNIVIDEKEFYLGFEWIMDENARRQERENFSAYQKQHPEKAVPTLVHVDGQQVQEVRWDGYRGGVAFAASMRADLLGVHKSYYRKYSFGPWHRASGILAAQVVAQVSPWDKTAKQLLQESRKAFFQPNQSMGAKAQQIHSTVEAFLQEYQIPGIQLAVAQKGKLIFSQGFGMADVAQSKEVTVNTRFRIGSVSKSLTAAALMQLVEQSKIDLDTPIEKYLPTFPAKRWPITARQLAGHLAGIRHYRNEADFIRTKHYTNAVEALTIFQEDSLLFEPGSKYSYSSFGWNILTALIEQVSATSYLQYMQQHIFHPLAMKHTCGDTTSVIKDKSLFYDEQGRIAPREDLSYKYGSGGLLSTAEDLVKYGNALLGDSLLSADAKRQLFTSQQTTSGLYTGYGIGWQIGKDTNGRPIIYHGGHLSSSSAYLIIYPEHQLVIAYLANSSKGLHFDVKQIGDILNSQ